MPDNLSDLKRRVLQKRVQEKRAMEEADIVDPGMPAAQSAISGAGQGLTLGFSDELAGALRAGVDKAAGKAAQIWEGAEEDPSEPFSDLYRKYQKEQQDYTERAQKENPGSYLGGEVGGGIASSLVPGAAALAPIKGASLTANVARTAAGGALTGVGKSTGNIDSYEGLKDIVADAGKGAAIGGGVQYGLGKLAQGVGKIKPEALKKFAEERAVVATGANAAQRKALARQGLVHAQGRELLDKKIVTATSSLDDIARKAGEAKGKAGEEIGKALSDVDDLVKSTIKMIKSGEILSSPEAKKAIADNLGIEPTKKNITKELIEAFQFDMKKIGSRIRTEVIDPIEGVPQLKGEAEKLKKLADSFDEGGIQNLKFAQKIKTAQRKIGRQGSETLPQGFKDDVYGIIKSEMENVVGRTERLQEIASDEIPLQSTGISKSLGKYKEANKAYAAASEAEKRATDRSAQEMGNRQISLTDYLSMIAGLSSGSPGVGVAAAIANKASRTYGPQAQAVGADELSKLLERFPDLAKKISSTGYDAIQSGGLTSGLRAGAVDLGVNDRKRKKVRK